MKTMSVTERKKEKNTAAEDKMDVKCPLKGAVQSAPLNHNMSFNSSLIYRSSSNQRHDKFKNHKHFHINFFCNSRKPS